MCLVTMELCFIPLRVFYVWSFTNLETVKQKRGLTCDLLISIILYQNTYDNEAP